MSKKHTYLLLPRLLRAEVVVGLEAEDLHGSDVKMHQNVLEEDCTYVTFQVCKAFGLRELRPPLPLFYI